MGCLYPSRTGICFGSQRPPPVALQRTLERLRGYVSSSPYERSIPGVLRVGWVAGRGDLDDDRELRLSEVGVSGIACDIRLSDGGRMVSTVGERDAVGERDDLELEERGDEERNMEIGWERRKLLEGERIDERGMEGQPWSWFQQSPQTRESIMGEMGDSNSVKGILRGGWRKRRFDVSSKGVEREEQAAQKTPPHLRQC